jgi:hypothetical protein
MVARPNQKDKPSPKIAPNPNNKRRARNYRAYHRDCFRQRQQQDRCESVVRMPPDKIDDPGKIRRHCLSSREQHDVPESVAMIYVR